MSTTIIALLVGAAWITCGMSKLSDPVNVCSKFKCSSSNDDMKICEIPLAIKIKQVKVARELSREDCVSEYTRQNYGYAETSIWASESCRALFRVCYEQKERILSKIHKWSSRFDKSWDCKAIKLTKNIK
ncbi:hypothetical protein ScPMuIL_001078 [Solemya velum]